MGDANPIRTLEDYSKPSHEGYKNTIELLEGNNVVPLRSDTIWDFAKLVKAISLPQDASSTFDRCLIELEHQVQHLMKPYIAPIQPTQVNKITSSCEICSSPHDTQYFMDNPEQAFVKYASSRTDKAVGLVSNFMASQDAIFFMFEDDFKQQQSEMTNKIDTLLKAITDRITEAFLSDTLKILKLNVNSTSPGNFTYVIDFMIVEDISSIIDPRLSQVVLERPFVEISNMTHDPPERVIRFTNETDEISYKMPIR
nr:MAK10-like protein [Tanacetum cinerariifolium]GEY38170.1 MAK10-like protein [Tanacetum cinerariifolium]